MLEHPKKLLTTDEAAEVLGVKPDTLYRWRRLNRGPRYVQSKGFVRYTLDSINAWIAAGGDTADHQSAA